MIRLFPLLIRGLFLLPLVTELVPVSSSQSESSDAKEQEEDKSSLMDHSVTSDARDEYHPLVFDRNDGTDCIDSIDSPFE